MLPGEVDGSPAVKVHSIREAEESRPGFQPVFGRMFMIWRLEFFLFSLFSSFS